MKEAFRTVYPPRIGGSSLTSPPTTPGGRTTLYSVIHCSPSSRAKPCSSRKPDCNENLVWMRSRGALPRARLRCWNGGSPCRRARRGSDRVALEHELLHDREQRNSHRSCSHRRHREARSWHNARQREICRVTLGTPSQS